MGVARTFPGVIVSYAVKILEQSSQGVTRGSPISPSYQIPHLEVHIIHRYRYPFISSLISVRPSTPVLPQVTQPAVTNPPLYVKTIGTNLVPNLEHHRKVLHNMCENIITFYKGTLKIQFSRHWRQWWEKVEFTMVVRQLSYNHRLTFAS